MFFRQEFPCLIATNNMAFTSGQKGCALMALVVGVALAVWGFVDALKKQAPSESDKQYSTRMLRGISLVLLALFVSTVGGSLCLALVEWLSKSA